MIVGICTVLLLYSQGTCKISHITSDSNANNVITAVSSGRRVSVSGRAYISDTLGEYEYSSYYLPVVELDVGWPLLCVSVKWTNKRVVTSSILHGKSAIDGVSIDTERFRARVAWSKLALNTIVYAIFIGALWQFASSAIARFRNRRATNICPNCSYPLISVVCPECGEKCSVQ